VTDVLAAEWLKLRSIRSTHYVLAVVALGVLAGVLVTWFGVANWDGAPADRRTAWSTPVEQGMLPVIQLCLAVLGVLAMTTEYATRTIRVTVVAVPRRWTVLAGKAAVVGGIALAAGLVVMFVVFFASRFIVGDRPWPGYISSPVDEIPRLLVCALSVTVAALVGLGLGTVLRSTAGAVVVVCLLLLGAPVFRGLLPSPWDARLDAVLLANLPAQFAGDGDVLSAAGALTALAAYLVVFLAVPLVVFARRDA
jgi:ABC-type transport system involved in multi-copper enzyme maturation permease subunit